MNVAESLNLPNLDEVMCERNLGIGDLAMYAAMSPESRERLPENFAVLEPYAAAGLLAVQQEITQVSHLRIVK